MKAILKTLAYEGIDEGYWYPTIQCPLPFPLDPQDTNCIHLCPLEYSSCLRICLYSIQINSCLIVFFVSDLKQVCVMEINLMLPTSIVFCLRLFSFSSRLTPVPQCRQSSVFFCILSVFYPLSFPPKSLISCIDCLLSIHILLP